MLRRMRVQLYCLYVSGAITKWLPMECVCIREVSVSGHLTVVVFPLHEMSSVINNKFTNL